MAEYNFQGDIDNISERQLEYINNVILELGFENSKVTFEPVGVAGDNYMANVKRIIIEGENKNLNMIAKIAPSIEMFRQMANTSIVFKNEHLMYTEVLPKLVQLQKEADVPDEEQFRYAKCYGSLSEPLNEVILLEDLKTSNFVMLDRFEPLKDECVKSVLKNLAILHSMSYALRLKEPETFDKFKLNLTDIWTTNDQMHQMQIFLEGLENDTITLLKDTKYVNTVRHRIAKTIDNMQKLSKADNNSKYTIIQQGDVWTNNIMFRYKENKLEESILIDYQGCKESSPVTDIIYMIFNCTDYESRKEHFYEWIDYYHSELEKSLANHNIKANLAYPRENLDTDLKRYGKAMFGITLSVASILIRKSDDAAKLMQVMKEENGFAMTDSVKAFNVSHLDNESIIRFKERVVGLIKSFTEFGLC